MSLKDGAITKQWLINIVPNPFLLEREGHHTRLYPRSCHFIHRFSVRLMISSSAKENAIADSMKGNAISTIGYKKPLEIERGFDSKVAKKSVRFMLITKVARYTGQQTTKPPYYLRSKLNSSSLQVHLDCQI